MSEPLVVEVVRSGVVESEHLVDVAVVDRSGTLIASAGDPDRRAAFRSSAKPIQARVAREAGWEPADQRALAIACASHNGEPDHVEAVRAILSAAGLDEAALRCPPAVPFEPRSWPRYPGEAAIHHNCSGKHAAMLAACVAAGWDVDSYPDLAHPLQRANRARLAELTGRADPPMLVDGCGVPTPVGSLRGFASAFLSIDDGGPETAAMRAEPFLAGGTGRLDTDLMRATPSFAAKSGAEGLACLTDGTLGIALKARDGAPRFRAPAVLHVLRALELISAGDAEDLALHANPPVLGGGLAVGELRCRGALRS